MKTRMNFFEMVLTLLVFLFSSHVASAYYDPGVQRWVNRDPMGEPGFEVLERKQIALTKLWDRLTKGAPLSHMPNQYVFSGNDSIGLVDSDGRDWWPPNRWPFWPFVKDKVKDKVKDEIEDKIKDYLGGKLMKDAEEACKKIKCMDHSDPNYEITCQLCAISQCAKKLPTTVLALELCLKTKWSKCAAGDDP